jgi:predicted ATPase
VAPDGAPARIRTPDQRLRVFVSSTLGELAGERQAARRALERLRLTPVMFELGARPHPPRALYRSYLEQSDVFVGIYWQRYGWVAPDMSVSGLEDEYVLSDGMPRLVYVKRPAPDAEPRLRDMLARLQQEDTTSYKPFADAAELERLLLDDLAILLAERFDRAGERRAPAVAPTNLPAPPTELVGRETVLAELRSLLTAEDVRLVTLTGTGGIGKTRLALEAARAELPCFSDGVFFTDLNEQRAPDDAYAAILRSVPIDRVGEDPPLEALKRHLRDRQTLLVLDNFEQVEDAAPGIAQLLEHAPRLHALVTSRAALRIRGERRLPLAPLSLPSPEDARGITAETALGYEAIRLFRDRAVAVRPDFRVTDENVADVAAICARLDALPLAIELAAARVTLFSVDELRARIERHVDVLSTAAHDLPERQQTLRRTIDWSYELLSEPERAVFQLLSVFTNAQVTDVEAAAARIPSLDVDVLDALARLVDKSLVAGTSGTDGRPRFSMLQTIRDYAADRLAEDETFALAARDAHAGHYSDVVDRLRATADATGRESVLATVSEELGNLRTTWSYWVERGDVARLGDVLELLWGYYDARGNYRAATDLGEDLLAVLARLPETPELVRDRLAIETALARSLIAAAGFSAESERRAADVLSRSSQSDDGAQRFPALRSLGWLYMMRSDFAKTGAVARDLLAAAEEQRDPALLSEAHLVFGVTKVWVNDMPSALRHVDQAVEYGERARPGFVRLRVGPDPRVLSLVVSGLIKWTAGYPEQALARAKRGVELAAEIDHPYSVAYGIFHAGLLDLWAHQADVLRTRMDELLDVSTTHDYPVWRALAHVLRGTARAVSGEPEEGLREVEQGVALYEGLTTPPIFWPILLTIRARAHLLAGRLDAATSILSEAEVLVQPGDPLVPDLAIARGDLLLAAGRPDAAEVEEAYERAGALARAGALRMAELEAATRLARLHAGTVREAEAARAVRVLLDRFTEGFSTPQLLAASAVAEPRAST